MATHTPITPVPAAEVAGFTTPATPAVASPLETAFSALLTALTSFVSAESDPAHVDGWNPAFSGWLREAEIAQDRVIDALRRVRDARMQRAEELPLRRLALIIDGMMGSEDRGDFDRLHRLTVSDSILLRCAPVSSAACRVHAMLEAGLALADELTGLDLYGGGSPGGSSEALLGQELATALI